MAKYADNGGAKTKRELTTYFGHYYMRDPLAHTLRRFANASEMVLRRVLPEDTATFRVAKRIYHARVARQGRQISRPIGE